MGGKFYKNYAAAVDNEIRYHINRGEIRQGSFDKDLPGAPSDLSPADEKKLIIAGGSEE